MLNMIKKIIQTKQSLTVIVGDLVFTKLEPSKEFTQTVHDSTTIEEIKELFENKEEVKYIKAEQSDLEKIIEENYNKVINIFKKNPKEYYLYKDKLSGIYKIAKDILINSKSFKEKNNEIIGNIYELYNNKLHQILKNKVVNLK